jgi:hypothetical protein
MVDATADSETRTGGCLCGHIRFTVTGAPDYPHTCSCPHCQRLGGGPMMAWVGFPMLGLSWTGDGNEPTWFDTFPDETARGFCNRCGSSIAAKDYGDTMIGINTSALDRPDDPALVPVAQSFRHTAVPWLPTVPTTSHHRTS